VTFVKKKKKIPDGTWGGQHINLVVKGNSATIEYDCAHGEINGPLVVSSNGSFKLTGTHTVERGGPVRRDQPSNSRHAAYTGTIRGDVMTLMVTLSEPEENVGTFSLVHGKPGEIFKCR
jgi:hypothetical protein